MTPKTFDYATGVGVGNVEQLLSAETAAYAVVASAEGGVCQAALFKATVPDVNSCIPAKL